MEIETGVDIIEVERIEKCIKEFDQRFLKKIYTDKEIEYCEAKGVLKYQHYAGRFAAKEAVYKALSGCIGDTFEFNNIEVINDKNGKPKVRLLSGNLEKVENMSLSISHVKDNAIAVVTVVFKGG